MGDYFITIALFSIIRGKEVAYYIFYNTFYRLYLILNFNT